MMSHFFSDPDPEFQMAGVQAYNNWIAEELVKVAPDRLIGLAIERHRIERGLASAPGLP